MMEVRISLNKTRTGYPAGTPKIDSPSARPDLLVSTRAVTDRGTTYRNGQ